MNKWQGWGLLHFSLPPDDSQAQENSFGINACGTMSGRIRYQFAKKFPRGAKSMIGRNIAIATYIVMTTMLVGVNGEELPKVSQVGEQGVLRSEFVFPLESPPTPQCHASTIVETSTGLACAWFGGTREGDDDVGIWLSRRTADGWSMPQRIASGKEDEERDFPCWNPVLFQPQAGNLMLFYKVGPNPQTWWGMVTTSADGGKTWSDRHRLGTDEKLGNLIGPVKNKPIQLPGGAILCPASTEHAGWRVHFETSLDGGKTWHVIGPINDGKEYGAIQPSILVHPNEQLQVLCRSQQNVVTQAWSNDAGKTWGTMTATNLPNPNSGTDAVTLQDGSHLIVYNHTIRGGEFPNNRAMLNVAYSKDGKNWQPILTLEKEKGEFSYPAIIQTDDQQVHITYTYQRKTIKHVVLDWQVCREAISGGK